MADDGNARRRAPLIVSMRYSVTRGEPGRSSPLRPRCGGAERQSASACRRPERLKHSIFPFSALSPKDLTGKSACARERFYMGVSAPVNNFDALKVQSVTPKCNRGMIPATLWSKLFHKNAPVRNDLIY